MNMRFLLLILVLFFTQMSFSQNLVWHLFHPLTKDTLLVGEKGTVQEVLIKKGDLPDPYYGENESKFNWIEKHDWTFFAVFTITEEQFKQDFIEINFPSIDTYATIFIDNQEVAKTTNAFHSHRIDIKKQVKLGENFIKVVFTSPINYHKIAYQNRTSKLPAPNDVGEIQVASMSRKPQYQFGWDWALRMNTIGFWKEAKVNCYSNNQVELIKYETVSIGLSKAELELLIIFKQELKHHIHLESTLFGKHTILLHKDKQLKHRVHLANPILWWPNGHGNQHLYEDTIRIYNDKNELIDTKYVRFGVRTSELIQEKDQWGTSFYFKINKQKIFAKGANFIPEDAIPSRINSSSTINLIKDMQLANFNMIRVWGGGYYQDEIFYQTCDELGIMVWQDFMFACSMYPGDDEFISSIKTEFSKQVPRIAAHPSVVYFNGNNEVDVAWKNWGFQVRYLIGPKTQREIEHDYKRIFKELAPHYVKEYSHLPYEHTSPLSNWGKDEFFNHGTMHYWGVWHGKDPIEDFGLKSGRFNAEYGFQSFPEFSTLKSVSEEKDWDLNSSVMKHHQKSYVGNGMIKKHSDILFGETSDFKTFIYYSQLTQAKAVGIAISGHRTDAPRTMGTLFWQLNDCWQAPTWSSIDYFHNWKALQCQVQKDYEPVAILERTRKIGEEEYFFVSDVTDSFQTDVKYEMFDLKGNQLLQQTEKLSVQGEWLQAIATDCQQDNFKKSNYIIRFTWKNHLGKSLTRSIYHETKRLTKAPQNSFTLELINIDEISKKASLKLTNQQFLANCWISSDILGVRFSENFEHYLPGEHLIEITFDTLPKKEDFQVFWR